MAAGRLVVPGWTPAVDADGTPIPNAQMFFYLNRTTTLATVYADEALTTPLANPILANSAGQWAAVWADDANLFSVAIDAPYGPPGVPFTFDDLGPSTSANAGALNKLDRDGGNAEAGVAENIGAVRITGDTITGPTLIQGAFQLRDLGLTVPPEGVYFGSGGNSLSFATMISTPSGGADTDNQRAQLLIVTETSDDGNSEEQSVCIQTKIQTGYAPEFVPLTAYIAGDNFIVAASNNVYRVTTSGVSGATAPTGKTTGIANGSMVVDWINDAAINAKLSIYDEIVVVEGAGSAWGEVINFDMQAGYAGGFACAKEIDLTNNTGFDSVFGAYNKIGQWIACQGANTSTAGAQISSANTSNWATLWGLYFAGAKLASNCVIGIDASSAIGIGAGVGAGTAATPTFTTAFIRDRSITPTGLSLAGTYSSAAASFPQGGGSPAAISISGTKTLAAYVDASTAPKAMDIQGTNSVAGVEVSATTPASFSSLGTKTIAGFLDDSTAPFGLNLTGTYSAAQVSGVDFSVLPDGSVVTKALRFVTTPFDAADDAAAAAGGILVNGVYRTGSVLKVRVT